MTQSKLDRLHQLATAFRSAIERLPPSALGIEWEHFPNGACGNATPLLGTFLHEMGEGDFRYVLGERPHSSGDGMQSHAWLQQGDTVVDITADQFEGGARVIVAPRPTPLHCTFEARSEHVADYRIYDPYTRAVLHRAYARIKSVLNTG